MSAACLILRKAARIGLLFTLACGGSAWADSIASYVHNETTGRPSVGDRVVLLLSAHGLEQESDTTTDDKGSFTLPVRLPGAQYVIRVVHGNVNYDLPWSHGTVPQIKVCDAVPSASGLTGYATLVKVESDGKNYTVTELHAIDNESKPPRTQAGPSNLEIYLPPKAEIVSAMAAGPQGPAVGIAPVPNGKEPGRYAIGFPLRPGMTRYAIRYRVTLSDRLVFHLRLNYPTKQVSVVIPKSMRFTALDKRGFHRIIDRDGVQVEVLNEAKAGRLPAFSVYGSGRLPEIRNAIAGTKELPAVGKNYHVNGQDALAANSLPAATGRITLWLLFIIFVVIGVGMFLV
ncbi:MAG: hypothetical protein WA738_02415, partial [Candidatus Angelobacter sp.]